MLTPIKIADGLTDERGRVLLQDPPLVPLLFSHAATAWLWPGVRLWLGYQWLPRAGGPRLDRRLRFGHSALLDHCPGHHPAGSARDYLRLVPRMFTDARR